MNIIALCGQKGGSGKTTTAVSLAVEWMKQGKRVLAVDCDPQGSLRTWGATAAEAQHAAPTVIAMGPGLHRDDQLPALARSFDVTIIDCPPRHGEIQRAALMVANLAILPCAPSALDAWALGESAEIVAAARNIRPELAAVVLLTRKIPRTVLAAGAREALAAVGLPLLKGELALRVTYVEALAAGLGPTTYAAKSPAADEVRALAVEVEQLLTPKKEKKAHAA